MDEKRRNRDKLIPLIKKLTKVFAGAAVNQVNANV